MLCSLHFLYWTATVLATATATLLTTETAQIGHGVNVKTQASYNQVFARWERPLPKGPEGCTFCGCCCDCPLVGCLFAPVIAPNTHSATWAEKTLVSITAISTPTLPSPPANVVTAASGPIRTTIVRTEPVGTTGTPNSTAPVPLPSPGRPGAHGPNPQICRRALEKNGRAPEPGVEITATYYTIELIGRNGGVLPIITTNSEGEALTLLATANLTLLSNFISASLVDALGLTESIHKAQSESHFLPERDLSKLFGYESKAVGELSLNVLVGVNDSMYDDVQLTVMAAPGETVGWVKPDLVVGMYFLHRIGALQLTDEFTGSRAAGPREGMGVLVQRVFEGKPWDDLDEAAGHDEL